MFNILQNSSLQVNEVLRSLPAYAKKVVINYNFNFKFNKEFILKYFKIIIDKNFLSLDYYKRREIISLYDLGKIGQPELIKKLPQLIYDDFRHIFYFCTKFDNALAFETNVNIGGFEIPKLLHIMILLVNGVKTTLHYPEGDVTLCPRNINITQPEEGFNLADRDAFLRICFRLCLVLRVLGLTDFVTIDSAHKIFTTDFFMFNMNSKEVDGKLVLELPGSESKEDILIYSMLITNLSIDTSYKKQCFDFPVDLDDYDMLICNILGIELPVTQTLKNLETSSQSFSATLKPLKPFEGESKSKEVTDIKDSVFGKESTPFNEKKKE